MTDVQPNIYISQFKSICLITYKSYFTHKNALKFVPLPNELVAQFLKTEKSNKYSSHGKTGLAFVMS